MAIGLVDVLYKLRTKKSQSLRSTVFSNRDLLIPGRFLRL